MTETTLALAALATLLALAILTPGPARGGAGQDGTSADLASEVVDWKALLGPPRGSWPEALEEVLWRSDLAAARQQALETGRPLFVTVRCLPCKQCSDFDQDVLEGGPLLGPLLAQFITVRLSDARALDLRLLPVAEFQDLDLSWWGWLLSDDARLYGVFGGRDEVSDTTRISTQALANTLRRVLDHHYDPRRAAWNIDGPAPELGGQSRRPDDLAGFDSWARQYPEAAGGACLHCHQVAEVLRQPAIDAGTFDKRRDLGLWPLPENVGLVLDRDDGLRVTSVVESSPAGRAGLRAGDELRAAGGRRLFGQTDLRAALHRSADPRGTLEVHWLRAGLLHSAELELEPGWRATALDWRMSISQGNIGAAPGFPFPLRAKRRGIPAHSMAVEPFFGQHAEQSVAYRAGLRPEHTIIAVNGEQPDLYGRRFLIWFRLRFEPGDPITLTVLDEGRRRDISYTLPGGPE